MKIDTPPTLDCEALQQQTEATVPLAPDVVPPQIFAPATVPHPLWRRLLGRLPLLRSAHAALRTLRQLHRRQAPAELDNLQARIAELETSQQRLAARLVDAQSRAFHRSEALAADIALLARARGNATAQGEGTVASVPPAASPPEGFADFYLGLEDTHRGDPAAIRARLDPYLAEVQQAGAGSKDAPVLDLGCGRGEWLQRLGELGLTALGVDSNPAMIADAQARGLHIIEGDLLAVLESSAPASLGAVTAFQVVEHLDTPSLYRLFRAAVAALRPGGVLILETPNPENLQVGAFSFWFDPTHVRPLPPSLLMQFAVQFGLEDKRILRSSPWPESQRLPEDSPAAARLNKMLFCEQDYALIARKPA